VNTHRGGVVVDTLLHIATLDQNSKSPYPGARSVAPEEMIRLMDECGVSWGLQVTPSYHQFDNAASIGLASRYPDRFAVVATLDPYAQSSLKHLQSLWTIPSVCSIRLCYPFGSKTAPGDDDASFFALAEELRVPISLLVPHDISSIAHLAQSFPSLVLIVDHVGMSWSADDPFKCWDQLQLLRSQENIFIRVSALPELTRERYPFPVAAARVRELYNLFGAGRLVWGSNFPTIERFASYGESIGLVGDLCTFLTSHEMESILSGTALELLKLPADPDSTEVRPSRAFQHVDEGA